MTQQPEALRLADELENLEATGWGGDCFALTEHSQQQAGEAAAELRRLHAQRDALLEALLRIESAVDWYLGRSSFTQTTQLKGLKHSANVRKELFAAHDEARAAIKAVEETK